MEYLKRQSAIATDVNQPEPQQSWPEELFERDAECKTQDLQKTDLAYRDALATLSPCYEALLSEVSR